MTDTSQTLPENMTKSLVTVEGEHAHCDISDQSPGGKAGSSTKSSTSIDLSGFGVNGIDDETVSMK